MVENENQAFLVEISMGLHCVGLIRPTFVLEIQVIRSFCLIVAVLVAVDLDEFDNPNR